MENVKKKIGFSFYPLLNMEPIFTLENSQNIYILEVVFTLVVIKEIEKVIDNNLYKKKFSAITFCLNESIDKVCKTSDIVIIAGKFIHIKEDKIIKAYKISNTWGKSGRTIIRMAG